LIKFWLIFLISFFFGHIRFFSWKLCKLSAYSSLYILLLYLWPICWVQSECRNNH